MGQIAPQVVGLLLVLLLMFCATVDAVGKEKADQVTAHLAPSFTYSINE